MFSIILIIISYKKISSYTMITTDSNKIYIKLNAHFDFYNIGEANLAMDCLNLIQFER